MEIFEKDSGQTAIYLIEYRGESKKALLFRCQEQKCADRRNLDK